MKVKAAGLVLALFAAVQVWATESIESADFSQMQVKARDSAARFGKGNVLLIYDIDNTLVTSAQDLGGDAWFNWQAGKISSGDFTDSVAPTMDGLIETQATLYSLSKSRVFEPQAPEIFNRLQREGFTTMILTSRGSNNHDATIRELARHGFNRTIRPLHGRGIAGPFIPYDIQHPEKSGLTPDEVRALGLGPARPVIYTDGLFMTSGQHKGAMMRALLHKLRRKFQAIILIDDTPKNVTRLHDAFDGIGVDVTTIRYSKLDPEVARFNASDKSTVAGQWRSLQQVIGGIFF